MKFQWKISHLFNFIQLKSNISKLFLCCPLKHLMSFSIQIIVKLNLVALLIRHRGSMDYYSIVPWMFFVVLQVTIWEENIAEESHSICEQLRCARWDWASKCFWFMLRYRAVSPVNSDIQWTFDICLSNLLLSIFMV